MRTTLPWCWKYGFFWLFWSFLLGPATGAWAQHGAQPGYIVPTPGDTLRGVVRVGRDQHNSRVCYFRPTGQTQRQYLPTQLLAYGGAGLHFESHLLPALTEADTAKRAFVEVIARGPLTLYYFRGAQGVRFFLGGYRSGHLTELISITEKVTQHSRGLDYVATIQRPLFRDTLARAMQACPTVANRLSEVAFQLKKLEQVVRDYNACVAPARNEPMRTPTANRRGNLQLAPMVGVGLIDRMVLGSGDDSNPYDASYRGEAYATAGLSVLYTPGLRGAPFLVHADVLYEYNRRYLALTEIPGDIYQRITLAFDYLRIPVLVRYSFGHGVVRPYLEAGVHVRVATIQRQDKLTFLSSTTQNTMPFFGSLQRMGYGYEAGAGLAIGPVQGRQLQVSVRAVRGTGPSPYTKGSTLTSIVTYVTFPLTKR